MLSIKAESMWWTDMKINSIQNFIDGRPFIGTSAASNVEDVELVTRRKEKPDFDVNREIANRTFIRPLPPKGHIVNDSILSAPLNFVQDIKTDMVALKAASSGNANDHQLGRLNDLGMKLGGLAIAGYLFSMKQAPVMKAMEFVGLGSFFASMALWPKIALDIPARLIHGFSPFMRYEDSQGRKKGFFSDNQFIPFDMLNEKDINRIGNRLHIPKDIPNRREAVEEKMRQIALQNNTMWMLTAGFATPIMSSLICSALQPVVENTYNSLMNKSVDDILSDISKRAANYKNTKIIDGVNRIIEQNRGKSITPEVIESLSSALTVGLDRNIKIGITKDLQNIYSSETYKITKDQTDMIQEIISENIKKVVKGKYSPEYLNYIIPSKEQLRGMFSEAEYYTIPQGKIEISNILSQISELVAHNINNAKARGVPVRQNMERRITEAAIAAPKDGKLKPIYEILMSNPSHIMNESAINDIRSLATILSDFSAENKALNVYSYRKLALAPDTAKAKYWNDFTKSLIKIMDITPEEIENTRYDRKLVAALFDKKMWEKATASEVEYKNFITSLAAEISKIEKFVKPDEINGKFIKQVEETLGAAASELRKKGYRNTAKKIVGENFIETGSLLGAIRSFVKNNLTNVQCTFASILNKANVYRKIYNDPKLDFLGKDKHIPKEIKEEIVALVEYLTSEGRFSDYAVKFDFLRNPNPNKADRGDISFKDGHISYKYYNPESLEKSGIFIKSDTNFFKQVFETLFNSPLTPETKNALVEFSSVNRMLETYRSKMFKSIGNIYNFMYPDHVAFEKFGSGKAYSTETAKMSSNIVGAPLDEVLTNTMRQMFNTRKWLKTFGGFGAGLLAFTVFTQFLFGKGNTVSQKKGPVQ